ncbi:TetR/AcrR family transcriptional regulator [Nocardia donostiensis]|uniref:TetR family transcriptional regulator n=1 Tax=Nocardia donostiensis TaxID=1538463 RepID=A0A1W0AQC1_9NOCA|nr:TetR/AcrR family transcriptional regulator [Nocardia donostiensis]ONM45928.1 TetR family transcriptional regulator [Nocardia donostiensis]OQS12436.1 TetR family transcriptional regulator [Nocardia donostiensis]OQS16086.1 TetR family transcriptional regulator [Nocardia donostiensis]
MNQRLSREESRQQTRDRLLGAAAELFAERGVNGTSVEQIAERAGYSRGAFYGNFADKHELTLELLTQRTQRELDEVAGLDHTSREPLREFNRARARHLDQWLALRLELVLHILRNPQLRPRLAKRELTARNAIATGITYELPHPPADPAFLALIVHALEDGLLVQKLLTPSGIPDDIVVDAYDLLIAAWAALAEKHCRPAQ